MSDSSVPCHCPLDGHSSLLTGLLVLLLPSPSLSCSTGAGRLTLTPDHIPPAGSEPSLDPSCSEILADFTPPTLCPKCMEAFGGGPSESVIGFTILLWVQQEYSGLSGMKWKETVDVSAGDVVERFGLLKRLGVRVAFQSRGWKEQCRGF